MKPNVSARVGTLVPLVFVLCSVLGVSSSTAQLFQLGDRIDEPTVRGASEERLLDLDLDALTTKASHLDLNLEPGHWHRAHLVEVEQRSNDSWTWRGRIATPGDSALLVNVTLTVHDGMLFGSFDLPSGSWVIQPSDSGAHHLAKIDTSLLPTCGGGLEPDAELVPDTLSDPSQGPALEPAGLDSLPSTLGEKDDKATAFVSVLGLYTPAARSGAGGPGAIQNVMEADIPAPAEVRLDLVQLELGRPGRAVKGA